MYPRQLLVYLIFWILIFIRMTFGGSGEILDHQKINSLYVIPDKRSVIRD